MKNIQKLAVQKTLLTSVVSYGAGELVDLEGVFDRFSVTAVWSGTTPTDLSFSIYGSVDGVILSELANRRMVGSADLFAIEGKPVRYVQGAYNARTGGDAATELSLSIIAGGN